MNSNTTQKINTHAEKQTHIHTGYIDSLSWDTG